MSDISDTNMPINLYEEELNDDRVCDLSSKELKMVPEMKNTTSLCVLYLQNNQIECLPEDFFPSLPNLSWLDLRDNRLIELPLSIKHHPNLTHLLLQNNSIISLPNELGTVENLKILQLNGNPLMYPPREIIKAGLSKLLGYLNDKYYENTVKSSQSDDLSENASLVNETIINFQGTGSYNSVIDNVKPKRAFSVQFSDKVLDDSDDEEDYSKIKGKCPKLPKSRKKTLPFYSQSSKCLKPAYADNRERMDEKIKQSYLKDLAMLKHKNLLARREKMIQDRKNIEQLKNWRQNYRHRQAFNRDSSYRLISFPYDTNPEYMTLLNREDIEKELPDKYRRRLVRKSRPTVPRKNPGDVHLAMKIKQLFENLESIDLNKGEMTPRTEQKVLLREIDKISEIKQKLSELSTNNIHSVNA